MSVNFPSDTVMVNWSTGAYLKWNFDNPSKVNNYLRLFDSRLWYYALFFFNKLTNVETLSASVRSQQQVTELEEVGGKY